MSLDGGPPPPDSLLCMTPEEINAKVLHRDGLILVLDKPAGIPVHKGPKGGASFEDYFDALRFGLPRRPSLAHRLDRDTSGCLVLGRHHKALEKLGRLFKQNRVSKTYWALVEGEPDDSGTIDMALGRLNPDRGWWMKPDPAGQPALTHFKVLGRAQDATGQPLAWLALMPQTGRTHQLRVHCAASGFPILGDTIYGGVAQVPPVTMHLHARHVTIPMSANGPPIDVDAPVPPHMTERLSACGWMGESAEAITSAFAPVPL